MNERIEAQMKTRRKQIPQREQLWAAESKQVPLVIARREVVERNDVHPVRGMLAIEPRMVPAQSILEPPAFRSRRFIYVSHDARENATGGVDRVCVVAEEWMRPEHHV
jgi:hypothetical protein